MVAHLLSLKWRLLLNGFRRSPGQIVGMAIGGLYALGVVASLAGALVALRWADTETAQTAVVLGGAAALLGWAVVPLMASAADMTLDPSRFTTTAIPMRQMLIGLALAGFIGVPGLSTMVVALFTVATWWRSAPAVLGALLGAVLGVLSCVVLSKVITTATAGLAASRRFKDVSNIVVLVPLVLMGPLVAGVIKGVSGSTGYLPELARTVAWTPLGAPWSLGGDLASGDVAGASIKVLISLATLLVLFAAWNALLKRALVTPRYSGGSGKRGGKLGLFGLLPATPTGAVAARALSYWIRDPRYAAALIVVPLLPVIFLFQSGQSGSYSLLMILGPLAAFVLAWSIAADVSYDSTAFALHLATGVRGLHDRLGRALACLSFALPVVLIFAIGPFFLTGDWDWLPGILGLSLGVLFTGLGLSSIVSARYTSSVPLPGDSPFKKPPGNVAQTLAVQFGGMAVLFFLVLPELALVVLQSITEDPRWGWINLATGTVLGVVLFVAGVRLGGRWLDRRGPELFAQLSVNR
ncbi:hypothetical protein [Arthrobacter sp. MA-N2]|uniref:hypothetical protein n=1 Tax=Arthrobacter sp. MA-N2 TaxID=1101188 RepID=UPI00048159AA|nr:hypothetical protein [Arthrobacter sp. MA-N2]